MVFFPKVAPFYWRGNVLTSVYTSVPVQSNNNNNNNINININNNNNNNNNM